MVSWCPASVVSQSINFLTDLGGDVMPAELGRRMQSPLKTAGIDQIFHDRLLFFIQRHIGHLFLLRSKITERFILKHLSDQS